MPRNQSRLITLIILLSILFSALFIKDPVAKLLTVKKKPYFDRIDSKSVSHLTISTASASTRLFKKEERWLTEKNKVSFPADQERIQMLLTNIFNLQKGELVSSNKKNHKSLGIDKQKIEVKTINKSYNIYIGNAVSITENYIKIDEENDVFRGNGLDSVFSPFDYRDLQLHFISDETKITSIVEYEFERNIKISISKKGKDWKIGDKTAKKDRIDFFLNDLKSLKAVDILPKRQNYETVKPQFIIEVKEKDKEKKLEFYSTGEDENYFVKTGFASFDYIVAAPYVAALKKESKDFTE